jgi:hypothetical protein
MAFLLNHIYCLWLALLPVHLNDRILDDEFAVWPIILSISGAKTQTSLDIHRPSGNLALVNDSNLHDTTSIPSDFEFLTFSPLPRSGTRVLKFAEDSPAGIV